MANTYHSLLTGALTALTALPAFTPEEDGGTAARRWTFRLADAPRWEGMLDGLYHVVVAPREDLAESVKLLAFGNVAVLGYEVYVGVAVPLDKSLATLAERTLARELIRLEMFDPAWLQATEAGQFNVEYDPAGGGAEPFPRTMKGSWQRFTYWNTQARQS